ncbi:hypothetical protein DRE_06452 [Drechslerella stenobrocha 248]|uniref:Uncharacterized protein n=1 Tax=Drechslerella stenobrocha 248 TaxID=1043628 RepID=W7HNV0_9PEZI|nr:hypothetical protein DRE_06452 [Drechslerella stenobrocha 248]
MPSPDYNREDSVEQILEKMTTLDADLEDDIIKAFRDNEIVSEWARDVESMKQEAENLRATDPRRVRDREWRSSWRGIWSNRRLADAKLDIAKCWVTFSSYNAQIAMFRCDACRMSVQRSARIKAAVDDFEGRYMQLGMALRNTDGLLGGIQGAYAVISDIAHGR